MTARRLSLILVCFGCSTPRPRTEPRSSLPERKTPSIETERARDAPQAGAIEPESAPSPTSDAVRCDDREWLSGDPPVDWWMSSVGHVANEKQRVGFRCVPTVRVMVHDASELVLETRAVRQSFGRFRVCYEAALGKEPQVLGHWVGRVTVGPDETACAVATVATSLPSAFETCVRESLESIRFTGGEAGTFEMALTFRVACRPMPRGSH
jgi:hypothetical protein